MPTMTPEAKGIRFVGLALITLTLIVRQLGMLNFSVNLRHRLLTAHGEDRMTQTNHDSNYPDRVRQRCVPQPPQRTTVLSR